MYMDMYMFYMYMTMYYTATFDWQLSEAHIGYRAMTKSKASPRQPAMSES